MLLTRLNRFWDTFRPNHTTQRKPGQTGRRTRRARNLAIEQLEDRTLLAADPQLLKDINPAGDSWPGSGGSPSSFLDVNGTAFFTADDGVHGRELWKSDGTEAGTVLVKDIYPGSGGSARTGILTNVNDTAYFFAVGSAGWGLWKSDGTEAGTVEVKLLLPDDFGDHLLEAAEANGMFFFQFNDGVHGRELWRSDGTESGTVMVTDIQSGSGELRPEQFTNVNGTLYFAGDQPSGRGLWKSDGTEAGTVPLVPGLGEMWEMTNVNGTLFFIGINWDLWKTDGTAVGTGQVKDIFPGTTPRVEELTDVNGTLFFAAEDSTGRGLWKSDGTEAGTVRVKDNIIQGGYPAWPTDVNGTLFFTGYDAVNGRELWKSDGTESGTILVKDINPDGYWGGDPAYLTNLNGTLYFLADDGVHGRELWMSDGTEAGTVLVQDINVGPNGIMTGAFYQEPLKNVSGVLYFVASESAYGIEPWILRSFDPSASEITILGNGVSISDNDTTPSSSDGTDFGSVAQGQAGLTRTYTVRNDGSALLTLGSVSVPPGFAVTEPLSSSLAAGASDTFTVWLDTSTTGTFSGDISFSTNDSDENPFNFAIRGTVAHLGFPFGLGAAGEDVGLAVTTDSAANVYVTGRFQGTVDFDPGPGIFNLTSANNSAFVGKYSSAGALVWARATGGSGYADGVGISIDPTGNIYIAGGFFGTVDFDPGPGTFELTHVGTSDGFILKLDTGGNFVWARLITGSAGDGVNAIAVDGTGNVYATGGFGSPSGGTADLDPGPGVFTVTSSGSPSGAGAFVLKLDGDGNFTWGASADVNGTSGVGIALDPSGNVLSTGGFTGTVDFDPRPGVFNLTSTANPVGNNNTYVWKLDNGGSFVWARSFAGTGGSGLGIAVDASGSVYTAGAMNGTVDFDPGAGVFNLSSSSGSRDAFVSKLDGNGNFVWAVGMGGPGDDFASGKSPITLDSSGNVYTFGRFENTVDFDPGSGVFNLTSAGNSDVFVSKLDNGGNFVWAVGMGGSTRDEAGGIALDRSNSVYTTGWFNYFGPAGNTADFEPGPGVFNLTSAGDADVFVSKLLQQCSDVGGSWSAAAAMPTPRGAFDVAVIDGKIYAVGGFSEGGFSDATGALPTLEVYDPASNTWMTKTSMAAARNGVAVGVVDGILYAIGGATAAVNGTPLNSVEAYDPATNTWTPRAPMPTPRAHLDVAVVNGIIYAIGGADGSILNTVEAYDPQTNTWTTKAPLLTARSSPGVEIVDGIIYATGGQTGPGIFTSTVEAYSPATNTWTTRASMPTGRGGHGVALLNGRIYTLGGNANFSAVQLNTVESYDPSGNSWRTEPAMPTGRDLLAATSVNGVLHAIGGRNSTAYLGTVEAFTPACAPPVVSLTVPSITNDRTPQVVVTASGGGGVPDDTIATLDVDTNNDGDFEDAGERGSTTVTLVGGSATFEIQPALADGQYRARARVSDQNGNEGQSPVQMLLVDATPPVITSSRSPQPNANGWNNTDVTVSFACADDLAGVASVTPPQPITSQGAGQSRTGTCTDLAGNAASTNESGINIDKTPPVISGTRTPGPNSAGWNNTDVTVSFNCSDALSGVSSVTAPQTISTEGTSQSRSGTCTDMAGNASSTTVSGINIDKTPPTIVGMQVTHPVKKNGATNWKKVNGIELTFSEPVNQAGAQSLLNYDLAMLSGRTVKHIPLVQATYNSQTVTLSPAMILNVKQLTRYSLTVNPTGDSIFPLTDVADNRLDGYGNGTSGGAFTRRLSQTFSSPPATFTLNVTKAGTGSGTVTSGPAGIDCGNDCSKRYAASRRVTLTAREDGDSRFTGWTDGPCSGTGPCTVTMNADASVTANFDRLPPSAAQTLTIVPQSLSGCLNGSNSVVNAQSLRAYGGSPFSGYTWTLATGSTFPFGTTVDPLTGIFHGNGGQVVLGTHQFTMVVSDGTHTASATFTFTVGPPDDPSIGCPADVFQQPTAATIRLPDATVGRSYGASLIVTVGAGVSGGKLPLSWSLAGGQLPPGLSLDASRGVVFGVPFTSAADQTYSFTVAIRDADGKLAVNSPTYLISVLLDEPNPTPAEIIVSPTSGLVTTEAGGTATFTVMLASRPTADVTIAFSSSDTTEGTVAPSSLTFNPASWNTPQTVRVTGVEDSEVDGDVLYAIVLAPATSSDTNYSGFDAADVAVTNRDNDLVTGPRIYAGSGSGTQTAKETIFNRCTYRHRITGDLTITLSGQGIATDPFTGPAEVSGRDTYTFLSGPNWCNSSGTDTFGPKTVNITSSQREIRFTATSFSSVLGFEVTTDFTGTVSADRSKIEGAATVIIPESGVNLANQVTLNQAAALAVAAAPSSDSPEAPLTGAEVRRMADQAAALWAVAGLDDEWLHRLRQIRFEITDLPGSILATATSEVILLDRTAAGYGWFVDSTPSKNDEFELGRGRTLRRAANDSPAQGRIDLLSVLSHEFGHVLGLEDLAPAGHSRELMSATVEPGQRVLPSADLVDSVLQAGL
jgi:ELWxxDGT repeat protein